MEPSVSSSRLPVTVVIPTYRRERVLLETIEQLLRLDRAAAEILVVDQSEGHEPETQAMLSRWHEDGSIRWQRREQPSIPLAMNAGLAAAGNEVVLFLDDDIRPEAGLVLAHHEMQSRGDMLIVAGRVIQPWEESQELPDSALSAFATIVPGPRREFMGGNFSVRRSQAMRIGGFDGNFVRVAYRFEAEFAYRWLARGGRIEFEPAACLHHLKAGGGGTRSFGDHLRSARPNHSVGAYYYVLRTRSGLAAAREFLTRPLRAIANRHHARRPWWVPITLLAELRGMLWACALAASGPRLMAADAPP